MSSIKHNLTNSMEEPSTKRLKISDDKVHVSAPLEELFQQAKGFACTLTDQQFAKCMDRIDPIRHLREEFYIPKMSTIPTVDKSLVNMADDGIYMCGNSLGLIPRSIKRYIEEELDKWANMGVLGHMSGRMPWAMADELLQSEMAKVVGAKENEVAIMNGLSVNLHLLMISFYQPTKERHKILIEEHAFPSDHYIAESQIRLHGFDPHTSLIVIKPRNGDHTIVHMSDVIDTIEREGDSIAVILLPGVQYYTGQVFDMEAITKAGHQKDCIVGFDLAHAVGNIELKLHEWDVDFASWCNYKYINGGAGAIAGAFLHDKHAANTCPRLTGWWGHQMTTRFDMSNEMDLASGIAGYRISNPGFLSLIPVKASLEIFSKTSMAALRKKSVLMTGYLEYLIKLHFSKPQSSETPGENSKNAEDGEEIYIDIITPSNVADRGSQLSLLFNTNVDEILTQLMKRGTLCDERKPNVLRIAPAPLYSKFEDVWRFVQTLREIVKSMRLQKMARSSDELD